MSDENKRASGKGVTNLSHVVDSYLKSLGAYLSVTAAIERSGYDVSPCLICGEPVVCIPDGIAICKDCAEKTSKEG